MIGGHGHVTPRPDGMRLRCGGPTICAECARELAIKVWAAPRGEALERFLDQEIGEE